MNYIVFDLEWNQGTLETTVSEIPFEIVEIGAIKLGEQHEMVDTFHILIKPQVYEEINYETHKVVPLNMEELMRDGMPFAQAVQSFFTWCGKEPYRFCTWGSMDLTELQKNLHYYDIPFPFETPIYYHDIQKCYGVQFEDGLIALESAVSALNIPQGEQFHRALDDAKYTAEIIFRLDKSIFEEYYSVNYYVNPKKKSEEIYIQYPTYQLYISREFESKEELMGDKEICSTRCYICKQNAKRKVRWYAANNHTYYCQAYCKQHGYLIGRIKVRKTNSEGVLAEKYLKLTDKTEAEIVRIRRDRIRERRREKKKEKRDQQRALVKQNAKQDK